MTELSYLAFAACNRRVSFVYLENGQLATWCSSPAAAQNGTSAAEFACEFIDLLRPNVVVVEDIQAGTRKGQKTQGLIRSIIEQAERSNAQLLPLAREQEFANRFAEAAHLAKLYPEVADKVPTREFYEGEPHTTVLFEALSYAHRALIGSALLLASKM